MTGPEYLLDVVDFGGEESHVVELAWHPAGQVAPESSGEWSAATLDDEFVSDVTRVACSAEKPVVLRARAEQGAELSVHLLFEGELLRATAPGIPGAGLAPFSWFAVGAGPRASSPSWHPDRTRGRYGASA